MTFRYANPRYDEDGSIIAEIDGQQVTIPDTAANRRRRELAAEETQGNTIALYAPPTPTAEMVRQVASQIIEDEIGQTWHQLNLLARFVFDLTDTLVAQGALDFSRVPPEVQQHYDATRAAWARIEHIRFRSNEIEQLNPIPMDFDDRSAPHWL